MSPSAAVMMFLVFAVQSDTFFALQKRISADDPKYVIQFIFYFADRKGSQQFPKLTSGGVA